MQVYIQRQKLLLLPIRESRLDTQLVEYLGTSGYPLGTFANNAKTNVLATASSQPSSLVVWTTTGLSSPVKQQLAAAFTPQSKGPIRARVALAKASTTVYYDPRIDLSY